MATAPTRDDLLARHPKLTTPADATQQQLLDDLLAEVWAEETEEDWGDLRTKAALLRAAHMWEQMYPASSGSGSRRAASKSVGDWSMTYLSTRVEASDAEDQETVYGRQYAALAARYRGGDWFGGISA